jgi:hypothetical protein
MKFSENYLQCYEFLDVAFSKHDLITLEKLAGSDYRGCKALDPGVLESPTFEIQTQFSN